MNAAGHRVIRLSETASTNTDAMRLALKGEPLPLWVTAETQTAGRGRAGRTWVSAAGNLHASIAFHTDAAPERAGQIALVAGLALFDAVGRLTDLDHRGLLRLKWPNDLLVRHSKVGGILAETTLAATGGLYAVCGFGLNIVSAPELDRPVTSLSDQDARADAGLVLAMLADGFDTWLEMWEEGRGFAKIRAAWLARGGPLGEPITINTGNGTVSAKYCGLSESGALLADVEGQLETFNFGDVALGASAGAENSE